MRSSCAFRKRPNRQTEWKRCSATGVTYYQRHTSAKRLRLGYRESYETSKAIYDAGIDFCFFSLTSPRQMPRILFYDGLDWLGRHAQGELIRYMRRGGHLVVFRDYPRMDERGERLNSLEIPLPSGIDSQGYMNTLYKDYLIRLGSAEALVQLPDAVHLFDEVPGEEIYATRIEPRHLLTDNVLEEYRYLVGLGELENALVGFHREEGNGSLTYLGVPPSAELILEVHRYQGIPIAALPLTPGIQTPLFERGDSHYLIVLNSGWKPKAAEILLDSNRFPGDRVVVGDRLWEGEKETVFAANADMKTITVNSDGRNGGFYELRAG